MAKPNIGQTGEESIRIHGKPVEECSLQAQMEVRNKTKLSARQMAVKEINRKYPPYKVPNLKAGIKEAEANIGRFEEAIRKERQTVSEFTTLVKLCEMRDKELESLGPE